MFRLQRRINPATGRERWTLFARDLESDEKRQRDDAPGTDLSQAQSFNQLVHRIRVDSRHVDRG
jgi:hypothetical protein